MIEDPAGEEYRKFGRLATVEDYYTKEKIQEMRKGLEKGSWIYKKPDSKNLQPVKNNNI
jgi:hypothetical protein